MVSDWVIAMCEIVMSNKWRHNVGYDFFHSRYDVITRTKNWYLTLWRHANDDVINFRRSENVKQQNGLRKGKVH